MAIYSFVQPYIDKASVKAQEWLSMVQSSFSTINGVGYTIKFLNHGTNLSDNTRDLREAIVHGLQGTHSKEEPKVYQKKPPNLSKPFARFSEEDLTRLRGAIQGNMLKQATTLDIKERQTLENMFNGVTFDSLMKAEDLAEVELVPEEVNFLKKVLRFHKVPELDELAEKIVMQGEPAEDTDDLVELLVIRDRVVTGWVIKTIFWQVSEALDKHRWNSRFLEELGPISDEGVPCIEQDGDTVHVAQVKRLINGLYHLEHTLKILETPWALSVANSAYKGSAENAGFFGTAKGVAGIAWGAKDLSNLSNLIEHGYKATTYLTQIDPAFLGGLSEEWEGFKKIIETKSITSLFSWFGGVMEQKPAKILEKVGFIQGLVIDQFRPYKNGGAELPLIARLAEIFGESLSEEVGTVNKFFNGTDSVLDLFGDLEVGSGEDSDLVDRFRSIVKEAAEKNPGQEQQRIQELNIIVAKLSKSLGKIGHGASSQLTNFIHYFAALWYTFDLITEISERGMELSEASKDALMRVTVLLRDHYGANLMVLSDKLEEVGIVKTGRFSDALLQWFSEMYEKLQNNSSITGSVPLQNLGPFESETLIQKRLETAFNRRQQCIKHELEIDQLYLPALDKLMAEDSDITAKDAPKLFNLLRGHIEAVNPKLSQDMVRHWLKNGAYETSCRQYIGHRDYEKIRARLLQLKQSYAFSSKIVTDRVNHIVEKRTKKAIFKQAMLDVLRGLKKARKLETELEKPVDVAAIKEVSPRKAEGYLVWHPDDISVDKVADASVTPQLKESLDKWHQYLDENYAIDPNAPEDLPMAMTKVKQVLKNWSDSAETAQSLKTVKSEERFTAGWSYLDPREYYKYTFGDWSREKAEKFNYVVQTILFFQNSIQGFITALPFATEAANKYQAVSQYTANLTKDLSEPYSNLSEDKDWAYRLMYDLLVAPEHIKTLGAGELTVDISKPEALDKKAGEFSRQVGTLVRHGGLGYALLRYPALIMDGVRIFLSRQVYKDTFDKDAIQAIKNLLQTTYNVTTEKGLLKLNKHVFLEMLRATDKLEAEMSLQPGELSNTVQAWIDAYRESLCEPLSLPSAMYFEILVDEASFKERWSGMGAKAPSQVRQDEIIEARRQHARRKNIDRALSLELIRIQKSETFHLAHAGHLYLDALSDALRPVMHAEIKGEEGVVKRVHHRMYEHSKRGLGVLDVYDKPKEGKKLQEGTVRLDAARAELLMLKRFTDANDAPMQLLLREMSYILGNESTAPSYRIQALHKFLNSDAVKQYMHEETTWSGLRGFGRFIAWVATCCGYLQSSNPTIEGLDNLVEIANPQTLELQVFDKHYAADYRRLDAMLGKVKAIEDYLDEVDKALYRKESHSFETEDSLNIKRGHMQHLRKISEDKSESVQSRIEAMRSYMLRPSFREDLLSYKPVEHWMTFDAVKRAVLWLMSCVGLYSMPCSVEEQQLFIASDPMSKYEKSPLIDVSVFADKPVSDLERNYTNESALERIKKP